ncbi:hypothetical protein K493DRAFT_257864 [Basidiobolus meristosporus CBS 931.73]|uniref:Uncharacterized protein n=1 Tax=Basidiobolus meristosporus CBS 931.73 TaxID=1314790 RepID=A0A1Y1YLH8_9FUNG|nr:hypothetical protein K493DRAFT_257864 [Basidiobolus meristosporus CBS 931.73]|eukprot:ORX98845.1 hypothetical protein K493DRAFT_257864 [Basidiobolus meristosporus CBS 931.73]
MSVHNTPNVKSPETRVIDLTGESSPVQGARKPFYAEKFRHSNLSHPEPSVSEKQKAYMPTFGSPSLLEKHRSNKAKPRYNYNFPGAKPHQLVPQNKKNTTPDNQNPRFPSKFRQQAMINNGGTPPEVLPASKLNKNKQLDLQQNRNLIELHSPNSPTWNRKFTARDIKNSANHGPYREYSPIETKKNQIANELERKKYGFDHSAGALDGGMKKSRDEIREFFQTIPEEVDVKCDIENPPGLKVTLMNHQFKGVAWMVDRENSQHNGGILADDMGLGKTVQTISLLLTNKPPTSETKSTLIVGPLALIKQWEKEIQTKVEKQAFSVYVHHGPSRTKDPLKLKQYDIVITTYNVVASEYTKESKKKDDDVPKAKSKLGPLYQMKWYRVVLDEAQTIKNKSTRSAQGCSSLSSVKRWCLTGTPIQNNVDELYSLLNFLKVKPYLHYPTFCDQITRPLQQGREQTAIKRLQVILKAIMLRRTKTTMIEGKPLLNLPERRVDICTIPFSPRERLFYEKLENKMQDRFKDILQQGGANRQYTNILCLLLRLRQACNHPNLVSSSVGVDLDSLDPVPQQDSEDQQLDDLADLLGGMALEKSTKKCSTCFEVLKNPSDLQCPDCVSAIASQAPLHEGHLMESAKISKMMDILKKTRAENPAFKTIIFSQFTSMLDLVEEPLKKGGFKFCRYDGSMVNKLREQSLEQLKSDPETTVLLISLKCGSLGLNLTCANRVILLDVWWNPALEEQAIDRVHRIGQQLPVHVVRLTIEGTVEDRIINLQEKKRQLAKGALGEIQSMKIGKLTMQDFLYLFDSNRE